MKGLLRILGICALSLLFPQFIFAQTWEQVYDIDIKDSGVSITETSDGGFAILAGHDHSTISSSDAVHLEMPRIAAQTGEIVCLPVKARNFTNITALQFSINFPVSHLSFAGVENFGLPNLGLPSFGYTNISLGQLGVSWDYFLPDGEGYSIPDESILFEICLEVIGTEGEHTISFSDEPITLAVIGTENSLLPVEHRDGSVHINLDWSQLLYYQTINIIRTDADGSVLWTTTLPADSTELANGLLETQDGGFVFGGTEVGANDSRAFIQKIDSDGTVVWKNILIDGSTNSRVRAITEAGDGGYLLTGTHNSDLFALKTDANGNELWRYTFDFGVLEEGTLISQLADGSFLISGYSFEHTLLIKINASGEAIWERAIFSADSYTSMVEASDGTLLLAGTQNIVAYDADGENPITYDLALEYIDVGAAFMVRANEDRLAYLSTGSTTDLGNDRNIFLTFLTENGQVLSTQQLTSTTLPMLVEPRDFVACANGGFAALNQLFQANGNQDVQLIKAVSDTQTTQGSIGDFVWEDRNGNGIQDLGEPGLPGVTINLLDGNGNQLATTTSAADGTYSFDGLAPGEYIVAFWAPAGFELVPANQGDDATDSDLDETTGQTGIIVIGSGETDNTVDAGFLEGVDLRLDKSVNVLLPPVGSEVEFTLRVRNDGASVATGVVVTDLLPSGYEFVSATGDYNPEIGAWNIGELANSTSTSMRIVARVLEEGDYLNMAEITAHDQEDIDSSPGNGVDTDGDGNVIDDPMDEDDGDAVNPFAATDLELDMSVNNLTPEVGEEVTFTVQVTNE
ncbi:MAG: SdrD B-like domain-containing protein, partial [Bacteroidota bacterium]